MPILFFAALAASIGRPLGLIGDHGHSLWLHRVVLLLPGIHSFGAFVFGSCSLALSLAQALRYT